ncbi:MAG: hypothetical protein Q4B70_05280 [Lachnospiraceae bacterium]|nr:hypothetical protein [Lachnospiraceae bacterium]
MSLKKIKRQILFWNYKSRLWNRTTSRFCQSLEEVKKILNSH